MEASAASEVSTATKTATTTAATVPSRPRRLTEGKQTEANYAKYSFCFHILSSRGRHVAAMAHPRDFVVPPKIYRSLPLRSECFLSLKPRSLTAAREGTDV